MPDPKPEDVKKEMGAGASCNWAPGRKETGDDPKPIPETPAKPPPTYELKFVIVESTDSSKKVSGIGLVDLSDDKLPDTKSGGGGLATFSGIKTNTSRAFKLTDVNPEKYRIKDSYGPYAPVLTGVPLINEIAIIPIIRIYLQLSFKDPDDKERMFPKGFSVKMIFEDPWDELPAKEKTFKIGDKGMLTDGDLEYVEVPRSVENFKLNLSQGNDKFFVAEKVGDAEAPLELKARGDLKIDELNTFRAFKLPNPWTLENSDWKCEGCTSFKKNKSVFDEIESNATEIGAKGSPAKLELNMHWQFTRFIYYDRWINGDDRLSIPPIMVQGYEDKKILTTDYTESNWVLNTDDKKHVQCIPWLIQKAGKTKPDADILIQFKTKTATFIETEKDKSKRKIISNVPNPIRYAANADRLRYYDLPEIWKSNKYYCKIDTAENRFEAVADKPASKDKPITFCLDDIVLAYGACIPLASNAGAAGNVNSLGVWGPKDRVAIISHYFSDKKYDGNTDPEPAALVGNLSLCGVYKPDTPDHEYLTKEPTGIETDRNYIADYPDWTRLVIAKGNIWEVFDRRIPAQSNGKDNDAVGARAAVGYLPLTKPFSGINTFEWDDATKDWVERPDRIPKPKRLLDPNRPALAKLTQFFAVQPFFEQRNPVRYREEFNAAGNGESTGRFDMALFRCCDYDGEKEISVNLHYFRYNFNFKVTPSIGKEPYKNKILANVNARWNGDGDGKGAVQTPRKRAKLIPIDTAIKTETAVVWFGQALPFDISHFVVDVLKTDSKGRDNRSGQTGTGESQGANFKDRGQPHNFASAHECGHADSLADEYNERWDGNSYGQLSLKYNLPGDPYEPDGREMASLNNAVPDGSPIMNGNQVVRNRHYWHCAEWVRRAIDPSKILKVKLDAYDNYFLPPHNTAGKSYVNWPLESKLHFEFPTVAPVTLNRSDINLFLYAHGEELYTKSIEAGQTYDGVLVVVINLKCTLPTWDVPADNEANRKSILMHLSEAVNGAGGFNNKYYIKGIVKDGTSRKWEFKRCRLQFSPRYVVINPAPVPTPEELTHANAVVTANVDDPDPVNPLTVDDAKVIQNNDEKNKLANDIITTFTPVYDLGINYDNKPVNDWIAVNYISELLTADEWDARTSDMTANRIPIKNQLSQYHTISLADYPARINKIATITSLIISSESSEIIPTRAEWETESSVTLSSRNVQNLLLVDAEVDTYRGLAADKLDERIESLRKLEQLCDDYITGTQSTIKMMNPASYKRIPTVSKLKISATFKYNELICCKLRVDAIARSDYFKTTDDSQSLYIQSNMDDTTWLDQIQNNFKEFFPGLLGIYKTPDKVVPADFMEMLTELNFKMDGSADVLEI